MAFSGIPFGVSRADIELPYGFELIDVEQVAAPELVIFTEMNNCGELVWEHRGVDVDGDGEIILFDNGVARQLTSNAYRDFSASINDDGFVAWTSRPGLEFSDERILVWDRYETHELGAGHQASINNNGHVAWSLLNPESCIFEASILHYDGSSTILIAEDGRSNQGVKINDSNMMAWTSYDFCPSPWESEIMLHAEGYTMIIPTSLSQAQGVSISGGGNIAWSGVWLNTTGIELWNNGKTSFLFEGESPKINDSGSIGFTSRDTPFDYDDAHLYSDGRFYRLTENEEILKAVNDINDYGELVIYWVTPFLEESGIRMLRRMRNGDVDIDGDVDAADFADFPACLTGPGDFERLCDCRFYDMGHDRDVALRDFALFQNSYAPGDGCCNDTHGPGCNDETVAACVCAVLPDCCTTDWTSSCVVLVNVLGCGDCP